MSKPELYYGGSVGNMMKGIIKNDELISWSINDAGVPHHDEIDNDHEREGTLSNIDGNLSIHWRVPFIPSSPSVILNWFSDYGNANEIEAVISPENPNGASSMDFIGTVGQLRRLFQDFKPPDPDDYDDGVKDGDFESDVNEWIGLARHRPSKKSDSSVAKWRGGRDNPGLEKKAEHLLRSMWSKRRRRKNPSDADDEGAVRDYIDVESEMASRILDEWKTARQKPKSKRGYQAWSVVPKPKLSQVWKSFAKYGFVRDEGKLDEIVSQIIANVAKIHINTILMGHSPDRPSDALRHWDDEEFDGNEDEAEKFLDGFEDFALTEDRNQWRISDQSQKLVNLAIDVLAAKSAEDKLVAVDRILNFVHPRSDLAASFVEGGTPTLVELGS